MTPEICPNCGAQVPPRARACPDCGADDETGWSEAADAQRLGVADDEFNYEEYIKEEFGERTEQVKPHGVKWVWWLVAVVLVALFASGLLSRLF